MDVGRRFSTDGQRRDREPRTRLRGAGQALPVNTTGAKARISSILIDCHDPERLAQFWSEFLGASVEGRRGPYVWLRIEETLTLGLQRVVESKRGKNRLHLDISVDDVDIAARRVIDLGGSHVPGYEAGGFLVMADPEGNEFCLLPSTPWEMDELGRADYLDR
jgi:predicted enzyme related to lactoylglutathione lyase